MAIDALRKPQFLLPTMLLVAGVGLQTGCNDCGGGLKSVQPVIEATPESIAFGTIPIGGSAEQLVNVSNKGRGLLKIASVVLEDDTDMAIPSSRVFVTNCDDTPRTSPDPMQISPGECTRFAVRFAPKSEREYGTKVVITSNDPTKETLEIPITGAGVVAPIGTIRACVLTADGMEDEALCSKLEEMPPFIPTVDFGAVLYGEENVRTVRVHNDGTGVLKLTDVHIESEVPDFSIKDSLDSPLSVNPGSSVDIRVALRPDGDRNVTGNLVLVSNDGAHTPLPIPLKALEEGPCLAIDPTSQMDFGTVAVGASRTLSLNLENCGHVTYDLTTLEFKSDQPSSTVYTVTGGNPQTPITFAPGDTKKVEVVYKPITSHTASDPGDTASISIRTSYGTRQAVRVTGRGTLSCGGQQPTAVIRVLQNGTAVNPATATFPPLTNVTIDGGSSTAATNWTIYKYDWKLLSAPTNNTSTVGTAKQFPFLLELAGDYVISLVTSAKDAGGNSCQSAPTQVTLKVVPPPGIHIELTWPQSFGDIDLHYVGPGGALYQGPSNTPQGDVYWTYSKQTLSGTSVVNTGTRKAPDWGKNNQVYPDNDKTNDASIDVDQIWGKGPENINHPKPFDGTFQVMAHTYCNRSCSVDFFGNVSCGNSLGAVTAHVRIYVDGVVEFDSTQSMTQRDVWEAASITVSGGVATVTPGTKAVYKSTTSPACSSATN